MDGWDGGYQEPNEQSYGEVVSMEKAKVVTEVASHSYTDDQRPCIVTRKPCGCYCAAAGLDEADLLEIVRWDMESDRDLPGIIEFLRGNAPPGATYEVRPVIFVRSGGLTFHCGHDTEQERC